MKIAVVGTGYVGLVSGTCFAEKGINVTCVDVDKDKISKLRAGEVPIYEPGLEEMIKHSYSAGRLKFETDLVKVLKDEVEIIFCAVGTPPDEDGSADLQYVKNVAKTIGQNINKYILFVTKSTVPVGTAKIVKKTIQDELDKRGSKVEFDVASNPEFLKEGNAVIDFMGPDRVVVGVESEKAKDLMTSLYRPFLLNKFRVIFMDIASAEMTKYAANSMLATRISFMNDIANLCSIIGADVNMVRKGIGSDSRIGNKFLYAGTGYGGSCFPKDVKALIKTAHKNGYEMEVIKAVEKVNEVQKTILYRKLVKYYEEKTGLKGDAAIKGKTIALWGLAFKAETDDMREAPSLVIIEKLKKAGCIVRAYDPIAIKEAKRRLGEDSLIYCKDVYDAANDADAILLVTEWNEFRMPTWEVIKKVMKNPVLFDGRNIYSNDQMKEVGMEYFCIGQ